jgi:hypothetical protein
VTYDPLEPTVRDRIRRLVRDHSSDAAEEFFPDDTYDRVIGQHVNWKRACAEMAVSVAGVLEDDPSRVEDLAWTERTKSLYKLRDQMLSEANAEDAAAASAPVPIVAPWMAIVPGPDWTGGRRD